MQRSCSRQDSATLHMHPEDDPPAVHTQLVTQHAHAQPHTARTLRKMNQPWTAPSPGVTHSRRPLVEPALMSAISCSWNESGWRGGVGGVKCEYQGWERGGPSGMPAKAAQAHCRCLPSEHQTTQNNQSVGGALQCALTLLAPDVVGAALHAVKVAEHPFLQGGRARGVRAAAGDVPHAKLVPVCAVQLLLALAILTNPHSSVPPQAIGGHSTRRSPAPLPTSWAARSRSCSAVEGRAMEPLTTSFSQRASSATVSTC